MARLPDVLSVLDLPLAELCAARIDGDVVALDECWAPVDATSELLGRAMALRASFDDRLVGARQTALWLHGVALTPPAVHQFYVDPRVRARLVSGRRAEVREAALPSGDVARRGSMLFTTPLRTALDLLRDAKVADETAVALVAATMQRFDLGCETIEQELRTHRSIPFSRQGIERLGAVESVQSSLCSRSGAIGSRPRLPRSTPAIDSGRSTRGIVPNGSSTRPAPRDGITPR